MELKDNQGKSSSKVDDSLIATVYVAAPLLENYTLAIVGENELLGEWKKHKGHFEKLYQINEDIYIFQGKIPVPSIPGSPFKFAHFNTIEKKIVLEGEGKTDNRTDELLPGSTNFFLFKLKSKLIFGKLFRFLSFFQKSETKEKIAGEFFNTLFDHTCRNILPDWDTAYEFVGESLWKIQQAVGDCTSDGFRKFINQRCENPEQKIRFDQLLLLIIAAKKLDLPLRNSMMAAIQTNCKEISLYLHSSFKLFKRNLPGFLSVMEHFVQYAEPDLSDFWWILFHINHPEGKLAKYDCQKVSKSILTTLQEIPEVLLSNENVASRVVDYLAHWNEVNELHRKLQPILAVNVNYQQLINTLLLQKFLIHKTEMSDMEEILRSDFLNIAYQSKIRTDSNHPHSACGALFEDAIRKIFSQKLSDVIRLTRHVPDYLLPGVIPVVENVVNQKIKSISNFNTADYTYFAQLDPNQLNNFRTTKQMIEGKLLEMTRKQLESGFFQSVPSLRLILLVLSETTDLPLLDRPKVVDLQKTLSLDRLPQNYLQNLHCVIKLPNVSVDQTLKQYRKGKTKEIVERLENHFDHLDEILNQVKNRLVPLVELTSLNACFIFRLLYLS